VFREYEGTILFVSHYSAFINSVADRLLILDNQSIKEFEGTLQKYKSGCQKTQTAVMTETEKTILQMRITEIVAKLSRPNSDKEALEEEYQSLITQIKRQL